MPPKHWLEVSLDAGRDDSDLIEDALVEAGAQAVTLAEAAASNPILEPAPGETPLWQKLRIQGLFPPDTDSGQVNALLAARLGDSGREAVCRLVEDRDWVRAWRAHFLPMPFGRRLWVCPRHQKPSNNHEGAVIVEMEPGLAFGTGAHPSTALCLEWLDGADLASARVMDYGCGSGILGIAALKLGAATATGVDIDPQAVRASTENARANGVTGRWRSHGAEAAPKGPVDVLLANILAAPLKALAPALARRVRPGGYVVLAGVLQRQAEEVGAAYTQWFEMEVPVLRDGWALLCGLRRGHAGRRSEPWRRPER
jgi:ribosomal protein L11 methyltransferase